MAIEGTQQGVLQQLGVSYPQLIDYTSKQYVSTLVRPTCPPQTRPLPTDLINQVQVGILVLMTWDCINTLYALFPLSNLTQPKYC